MTDGILGGIVGAVSVVILLFIWARIDQWLLNRQRLQGRRFKFK